MCALKMSDEAKRNEALDDDDIREINSAIRSFGEAKSPTVEHCKDALRALRDENDWNRSGLRLEECKRICSDILDSLDHDKVDATIEYCPLLAKISWRHVDDVVDCFGHMMIRLLKAESFAEKQRDIVCFREIIDAVRLIDRIFETRLIVFTRKQKQSYVSGVTSQDMDDLVSSIRRIRTRTSEDDVARVLCRLVESLTNDHYYTNTCTNEMRLHSSMLNSVIAFFADPAVASNPEEFIIRKLQIVASVEEAISGHPSVLDVGCMVRGMITGRCVEDSRDSHGPLFDDFLAAFQIVKNVIHYRFLGGSDEVPVPQLEVTLGNLAVEMDQQRLSSSAMEEESMADESMAEEEVKRPDPRSSSSSSASPVYKGSRARPREPRHKEFERTSRTLLRRECVLLQRIGKQCIDVHKQIQCVKRAIARDKESGPEYDVFEKIGEVSEYLGFFFCGVKYSLKDRALTSDYRNVMRRCVEAADNLANGRPVGDLLAKRFGLPDGKMRNDDYLHQFNYMQVACEQMATAINECKSINEHAHATICHIARLVAKGLSILESMR